MKSLKVESLLLKFDREINFGRNFDWYVGTVVAYVKRITEKLPRETFMGEVCSGDGRQSIEEIFCELSVGLPSTFEADNRLEIFIEINIVVEGIAVATKSKRVEFGEASLLMNHKAMIPVWDYIDCTSLDDIKLFIDKHMITSIINELLSNCEARIDLNLDRTAQGTLFDNFGRIYLRTGVGTF